VKEELETWYKCWSTMKSRVFPVSCREVGAASRLLVTNRCGAIAAMGCRKVQRFRRQRTPPESAANQEAAPQGNRAKRFIILSSRPIKALVWRTVQGVWFGKSVDG